MAAGVPAYTVKVHAKFPGQMPSIRGVLCLHDLYTGVLMAVMDSTYLTAVRTGVTAAVAADALARGDAESVAVIGAGMQGREQLYALAALRPIRRARVFDLDGEVADAFCRTAMDQLRIPVEAAPSVEHAVEEAGIVLAATWSRAPFLHPGMLKRGVHVNTLGPDEPGKAEVIRCALFVCDDRDLAVEMGSLAGVGLGAEAVAAELGEVLAGVHPGRTSPGQTTVYGAVGLAVQDAVAAWWVYEEARRRGVGQAIDFLR